MAKHRRIPKKNRKKLKAVDPFNKKGRAIRAEKVRNKNFKPESTADQPLTKKQKELLNGETVAHSTASEGPQKKTNSKKSKVVLEAEKLGVKKRKFETVERFAGRVKAIMRSSMKEKLVIAKHGMAGRDEKAIAEDYAKIDEREKRKKEQEKREIQNKIEDARKKRAIEERKYIEYLEKKEAKRKLRKLAEAEAAKAAGEEVDGEEGEEESEDAMALKILQQEKKKRKAENGEESKKEVEVVLTKKDRKKQVIKDKKEEERKRRHNEAVLNSKEVIEFGERYDAPPTFAGVFKTKFDPLNAKAGEKNLLLHSILQKGDQKTLYHEVDKKKVVGDGERQRVIDAYRALKKNKPQT